METNQRKNKIFIHEMEINMKNNYIKFIPIYDKIFESVERTAGATKHGTISIPIRDILFDANNLGIKITPDEFDKFLEGLKEYFNKLEINIGIYKSFETTFIKFMPKLVIKREPKFSYTTISKKEKEEIEIREENLTPEEIGRIYSEASFPGSKTQKSDEQEFIYIPESQKEIINIKIGQKDYLKEDINYLTFLGKMKNSFSTISKEEYNKIIYEDIDILRALLDKNIDLWKKERMNIDEMIDSDESQEDILKSLKNESNRVIDIALSCLILGSRINHELYIIDTKNFMRFMEKYDPKNQELAFTIFSELMMNLYQIDIYNVRSTFISLDPLRQTLDEMINKWKKNIEPLPPDKIEEIKNIYEMSGETFSEIEDKQERLGTEFADLSMIANYCAYIYSLIESISYEI